MEFDDANRIYGDSPVAFLEGSPGNEDNGPDMRLDNFGGRSSQGNDHEAEEGMFSPHSGHHEEKRNLRHTRGERRHSYQEDSDGEIDSDAEDFHQACLVNALPALKQYFLSRLEQTIAFLGGSLEVLKGWKVQVVKRTNGLTAGLLEIFYFNPRGKKLRSRVEVACFLNLMPAVKSLRTMTKDQFYLNAIETRERHLISQQLAVNHYACDEIIFHKDVVTLMSHDNDAKAVEGEENGRENKGDTKAPLGISFDDAKNLYFSFGNLVVLDWGRLIVDPAFHTTNQLYPLGFKCLRQEHDVTLDRVVDCLCEVDAVFEGGDGTCVLYMLKHNLPIDPHRPLQPLFRLSVAWHIGDETSIGTSTEQDHVQVRVYEARSPQQAWQAAMLESLGIKDESLLSVRPTSGETSPRSDSVKAESEKPAGGDDIPAEEEEDDEFGNTTDVASGAEEEEQDLEELQLRQRIREQRRAYFRVLRAEQSAGMQAAVRPRLSLETVDSFAEELISRLFEGMEGSINCRAYQYMDSREREGGKKNMLKCYSKAFAKAKNLDRVIRKNQYLSEQIQQLEQKRKRAEDQESRKRAKIEDKEIRSMVVAAQKSRNAKIKEMEKVITAMRVALSKTVKKRRDDAKLAAEVLCDKEEMQRFARTIAQAASPVGVGATAAALDATSPASMEVEAAGASATETAEMPSVPRPEPTSGSLILDGRVVGQLLEVWEFLRTFAADVRLPADQIPNAEELVRAAKAFDPSYRSVRDYTRSLDRSFDKVTLFEQPEPTDPQAAEVLNKLGVALTSCLVKDFDRAMGIDLAELQLGTLNVPVNALTWREIARVVLLSTCCRELGMSDVDVAALIKGRGYFTTPESADRKILKLARRRIKFAYGIRSELQESVYGFTTGLCARLPAPGNPFLEGSVLWSDLIASLRQVPDTCGWLIYEIVKAASLSVCIIDTTPSARKLKRSLQDTLGLQSFRMDNGAETKAAALKILEEEQIASQQWKLTNGRWRNTGSATSAASVDGGAVDDAAELSSAASTAGAADAASANEAAQLIRAKLQMAYDQTPYSVPTCTLDLWEKQMREALRHADFARPDGAALANSLADSDRMDAERDLTSAMDEDNDAEIADNQSVRNGSTKDGEEGSTPVETQQLVVDDDTKQAEKLSIAMQRCYLVVRDLMIHPQATAFNWPVDYTVLPSYYKAVAQPLSFSEVRKFLVEGKYKDSLFRFYTDVILVIENAMAYNQENSTVKVAAQKLLVVFERLFFETVLCWDNPLPFQDSCHACRSPHPISAGKMAVCDRCEGCYHLHCLDPPMQMPPRSEWYCLPCVEQKGIPSAHPYNTAEVVHPADPESRGEVVGIEVIRQTVMFVVEFGNVRELWDGRKVRRYAVEPVVDINAPRAVFQQMDDAERNQRQALGQVAAAPPASGIAAPAEGGSAAEFQPIAPAQSESAFAMPSGYDYEDYDRVCGVVRAYTGWGASHYLVPPAIMDQHNLAAVARTKNDVVFPLYRDCVAALGYAAGGVLGDTLSASEWGAVLNGLLHRVLDGSLVATTLSNLDDAVDDDLVLQIQEGVHANCLPLEKVFGFIRGEGLVKHVKPVVEEPDPNAPKRRGRKPRVRIESAAPETIKRSTSASSALGVEDDDNSADEDGEYEWEDDLDYLGASKTAASSKAQSVNGNGNGSAKKGAKKGGKRAGSNASPADFDDTVSGATDGVAAPEPVDETDSADEDDLEFFDADGNCLTSGTVAICALSPPPRNASTNNLNAPDSANGSAAEYQMGGEGGVPREGHEDSPQTGGRGASGAVVDQVEEPERQGPETEDDWNLRLLSRQKGREDALMTHTLVLDTLTQVDVDGSKEAEEEVFKQVNPEDIGGSYFQSATSAIVKTCLGRPSESLIAQEWTRGWETKMTAMQEYLNEYTFKDREVVCPICGFEESYLSSPMVWGQTGEEWEADVAADTAQDVLTEPEPSNEINAFPLAAGVSASTGIKGFRARARVMKGLVWMPCDPIEAQIEAEECAAMKRTIKKGSLMMHECCANFVHFNRQMKQDKSRKMEDLRVVEVITGIGRAKSTPIGIDRDGSFYWIFRDCTALFVSNSEHNTLREQAAEKHERPGTSRWCVYHTVADINTILNWLDPKIPTERVLRKVLSVLYPAAVTDEAESAKHCCAPAAASGAAQDNASAEGVPAAMESKEGQEPGMEIDAVVVAVEPPLPLDAPVLAAPIALRHERPAGSLLLSGDIMEQSGDEAGSDDEGGRLSTTSLARDASSAMDCDGDDNDNDAQAEDAAQTNLEESAVVTDEQSSPERVPTTKEAALQQVRRDAADEALRSRPALSQRSPLLDIYCPVEEAIVRVDKSTSARSAPFKFRKGDHVLVDASPRNHILWDAHVVDCKAYRLPQPRDGSTPNATEVVQVLLYRVRFDRWGAAYDGWYEECQLVSSSAMVSAVGRVKTTARALAQESKVTFIHQQVWTPPEILQSLNAFKFLKEPQRACGTAPPLSYSDCQSAIGQLRLAMLMIEAALPFGAVDDSDDRWGEDFVVPWRESVSVAGDAISLMQCQLMLEYGIRTSWLKPAGLKMFSCLPSRVQCVRNATLGLVAIRVWVLDATIKYEQIKKDDKPVSSGKGRPPKHPASGAAASASKGKKYK